MSHSGTRRDVRLRLESSWEGAGFDVATRAVTKMEQDYRRLAQAQMRAESEMQTALEQRAQATKRAEAEIAAAMQERARVAEQTNAKQRDAMTTLGTGILAVSGSMAVGLTVATQKAIEWESAWAGVRKTVDGSPEEMAELEGQLRLLATTLPATHTEIAAVAEAAGQLGIRREDIAGFTETMVALGETTNLSADQAATSLAQVMNIMKTAPEDVSRLGSTLVALGNAGASTERDILDMSLRLAGAGQLIGATEGQVLATASALASMGVSAEAGGGVTSRILQDIYSVVQSGGAKLDEFAAAAGMTADEFTAAWESDPIRALAMFAEGLNGVEASGGNVVEVLRDLEFKSSEEQRILLQLMANSDLLTDSLDMQAEAWESNTALMDEAVQRYQTTEAQLEVARNKINDAAITIGENFTPIVAQGAEGLGNMATAFGLLPPQAQSFVSTLGAAVTGVGLLVGGAAVAIPKMHELRTVLDAAGRGNSVLGRGLGATAGILMGPWGVGLAAAAVALAIFAQKQGEAEQRLQAFRATLDETARATDQTTQKIYTDLAQATSSWFSEDVRLSGRSMVDIMDNIGISAEDAAGYIEGNAAATQRVNDAFAEFESKHPGELFSTAGGQVKTLTNYLDEQRTALGGAIEQQEFLEEVLGEVGVASEGAAAGTEAVGDAALAAAAGVEELDEATADLLKVYSDADAEFIDLLGGYQSIIDKNREVADETAAATESSDDSWQDFYDGFSVGLEEYLTGLEEQVAAQEAWETNMLILSGRVSQGVLDHLATLGPEGAPLVADLVNASDAELSRLESVYGQASIDATGAFAQNLLSAGPVLMAIMRDAGDDAAAAAAQALASGEKTLQQIIDQYDLDFVVDADTGAAQATIRDFIAQQRTLVIQARVDADPNYTPAYSPNPIRRADGGRVQGPGTSTSDSIWAKVSNDEHVWSAAETAGARGHDRMDQLRAAALAGTLDGLLAGDRRYALPTGGGTTSAPAAASGAAAGPTYSMPITFQMPPGLPEHVAEVTAHAVKRQLSDSLATAGVSAGVTL